MLFKIHLSIDFAVLFPEECCMNTEKYSMNSCLYHSRQLYNYNGGQVSAYSIIEFDILNVVLEKWSSQKNEEKIYPSFTASKNSILTPKNKSKQFAWDNDISL